MANQSFKNPFTIDTPGTDAITHMGVERMNIVQIIWQSPTSAGDDLVLTINGSAVARKAPANNTDVYVTKQKVGWVDSIVPTTIDSGIVEIWIE